MIKVNEPVRTFPMVRHSYSAMNTFETCPRMYEAQYITGEIKFVSNEATDYGTVVHKAIENLFKHGTELPPEFEIYKSVTDGVTKLTKTATNVLVEFQMALDIDKQPCNFDDLDCWVRGIADLVIIKGNSAIILDWKTGKMRPSHDQMILMSLMLFEHFQHLVSIHSSLVWLKVSQLTKLNMYRNSMKSMWMKWEDRYIKLAKAVHDNKFPMQPNGLCKGWCGLTTCTNWSPKQERY